MKKNNSNHSDTGNAANKHNKNAGSGGFNQGSAQDSDFDKGTPVSDEEKRTGQPPSNLGKKKENPKDGNIGKNNAGGYK